ncbi:unnamed protein product [Adineta steineri]|uniref:NAD(P)(+)--arginine ADP-ribosyltransferase n=1 Tax=Adineta steineri TaxID=433720 RepID=A0A819U230_9BILA|nr:unnamed protein product [Adineta steineri]CAF4087600.1 unnamed protein product [Adineta steineri]
MKSSNVSADKREMIEICRREYLDDNVELRKIEEFEKDYAPDRAIYWYTRDSFLYRLINKSLRTMNTTILYKFRLFIKDLHEQLRELQQQSNITTYRGQLMGCHEFREKLQYNSGGLLSINNFLSTSLDKDLALIFAGSGTCSDTEAVLFEIEASSSLTAKSTFANIESKSSFSAECEILFSMGTVFRIQSVEKSEDELWHVCLTLTDDEDEQLRQLSEHVKIEIGSTSGISSLMTLGLLMTTMGEINRAKEFYEIILNDPILKNDFVTIVSVFNNLGVIYNELADYDKAKEYYQKSLDIYQKQFPAYNDTATTLGNLGNNSVDRGDLDLALDYYDRALKCLLNDSRPNERAVASQYNNIGLVYHEKDNFAEALKNYKKALEIQLQVLPSNHPMFADSYNNIGEIYRDQGDYAHALDYYNKTLQIQQRSLPPYHWEIARTYNNMALALSDQDKCSEALVYMRRAMEIAKHSLSTNHPTAVQFQKNMNGIQSKLFMTYSFRK